MLEKFDSPLPVIDHNPHDFRSLGQYQRDSVRHLVESGFYKRRARARAAEDRCEWERKRDWAAAVARQSNSTTLPRWQRGFYTR